MINKNMKMMMIVMEKACNNLQTYLCPGLDSNQHILANAAT